METLREILTNNSEIILYTRSKYVTGEGLLDGLEDDSILDTKDWASFYEVIDEKKLKEMFHDYLDQEFYSYEINDMLFYPSSILKNCDPIAYQQEFLKYKFELVE